MLVYRCLYTAQKTKKRKKWDDGVIICCPVSFKIQLQKWNESLGRHGQLLDSIFLSKREFSIYAKMIETELETEKYLISLESKSSEADIQPVPVEELEKRQLFLNDKENQSEVGNGAQGLGACRRRIRGTRKLIKTQGQTRPLKKFKPPSRVSEPKDVITLMNEERQRLHAQSLQASEPLDVTNHQRHSQSHSPWDLLEGLETAPHRTAGLSGAGDNSRQQTPGTPQAPQPNRFKRPALLFGNRKEYGVQNKAENLEEPVKEPSPRRTFQVHEQRDHSNHFQQPEAQKHTDHNEHDHILGQGQVQREMLQHQEPSYFSRKEFHRREDPILSQPGPGLGSDSSSSIVASLTALLTSQLPEEDKSVGSLNPTRMEGSSTKRVSWGSPIHQTKEIPNRLSADEVCSSPDDKMDEEAKIHSQVQSPNGNNSGYNSIQKFDEPVEKATAYIVDDSTNPLFGLHMPFLDDAFDVF